MSRKWFAITVLAVLGTSLLGLWSCARNQQLETITISPSSFTYFSPAAAGVTQTPIPLTAYGSYIHPPENKVITGQVTWSSDNSLVADVSSSGQLTAGVACGVANISATVYTDHGNTSGNAVVGFMTATVEGPSSEGCPTGTATNNLSVNITAGSADGVIASSPAGITCGAGETVCAAAFPSSSSVSLTATPNSGNSFLGWSGCQSVTGTDGLTCNVTMTGNLTVSASFN
jgi:Divergent InlB B-repeat domain/Bacterial Ig-like domain (group 2)